MPDHDRPAVLGGPRAFTTKLAVTRPTLPPTQELLGDLERVFESGMITNSQWVERLERSLAEYLQVHHVVAVSSCTSGLLLVLRALGLAGEVVLPSFTFAATGHVTVWNGLRPRFADIEPDTFNVDVRAVERAVGVETKAIIAVHIFGNPCQAEALQDLATRRRLRLVFDSAHALGSMVADRKVGGFGDAEVFSMSPTKLVVAGEGGVVATNDATLARLIRIGRDYGNPGNYDCEYAGLSARLGETNALLGVRSLQQLETNVERRQALAERYRKQLLSLPGLSLQEIRVGCRSTYKDFAILVDAKAFGIARDVLARALDAENIATRKYFDPPLHRQRAYCEVPPSDSPLTTTERVARSILCLPMFSHLEEHQVDKVCESIAQIYEHRHDITSAVTRVSA